MKQIFYVFRQPEKIRPPIEGVLQKFSFTAFTKHKNNFLKNIFFQIIHGRTHGGGNILPRKTGVGFTAGNVFKINNRLNMNGISDTSFGQVFSATVTQLISH